MEKFSHDNLKFLAYELAQNHYFNSAYDLLPKEDQEKVRSDQGYDLELLLEILNSPPNAPIYKIDINKKDKKYPDQVEAPKPLIGKPSRNILIIGAGATYNAFQDIPLGKDAQRLILSKITATQVSIKDQRGKEIGNESVSFEYFIKFYEQYSDSGEKIKDVDEIKIDLKINPDISEELHKKWEKNAKEELLRIAESGNLLTQVTDKYLSEYRKLKLLSHDQEEDTFFDFENSLNLLSQLIPISTLRKYIQDLYNKRHGPILFYQIVAHLFKNRFIDVIINFNFDEFLDEALSEELVPGAYDVVISDGDCKPLSTLAANGKLRQPLYIKPHGTASHKSTLRFTKDQYHELPLDLRNLLFEVLEGGSKNTIDFKKKTNLITVGFDMGSIEFNEMLQKAFDENDQIFSFFHHNLDDTEGYKNEIEKRRIIYSGIFKTLENCKKPNIYLIGHEFFHYTNKPDKQIEQDCSTTLGNTFLELYRYIQDSYQPRFMPGNIDRHLLICEIFGCNEFWKIAYDMRTPRKKEHLGGVKKPEKTSRQYPESYFNSECYFKDRLILQILIDLTFNQGMLNALMLSSGDAGKYYGLFYDTYQETRKEEYKGPPSLKNILIDMKLEDKGEDLQVINNTLMSRIMDLNSDDKSNNYKFPKIGGLFLENLLSSDALISKELSDFLKDVKSRNNRKWRRITQRFNGLYHAQNTAVQSNFRSTNFHLFEKYEPNDLITTNLTCNLIFYGNIRSCFDNNTNPFLPKTYKSNFEIDTILIIDDHGDNISKFLHLIEVSLGNKVKVFLILQDMKEILNNQDRLQIAKNNLKFSDRMTYPLNENWLNENVKIQFRHMNSHNHHMVLFMNYALGSIKEQCKTMTDAIYYYKWGLARTIEPIHICEDANLEYLLKRFYVESKVEDKGDPKSSPKPPPGWPTWD